MLRFKRETGRDATQMEGGSINDICTFLWCCVCSACKADGIEFNMSLMDFADNISPEDMTAWSADNVQEADVSDEAEGEKKS